MNPKHKEIHRTLQVLLWMWFGAMTSFVSTNVANIVKLETDSQITHEKIKNLEERLLLLKYNSTSN